MNKILTALLLTVSFGAFASDNWTSTDGTVVRTSDGQCLRDSSWTPATADPRCAESKALQVVKPVQKVTTISLSAASLFDFDKSVLKAEGRRQLDKLVADIKGTTVSRITIVGHTDSVGTDAYNQRLSVRRAQAVLDYLVKHGVSGNLMELSGEGKRHPVADNKTAAGRAQNRRVVIEVTGVAK